ncbi:hypothetical protein, partial [Peribacillus simplex]|uniref:hypothetical protein n=1 Tax=Peribacillus simplex TaxID=1478 RepID=UPI001E2AC794
FIFSPRYSVPLLNYKLIIFLEKAATRKAQSCRIIGTSASNCGANIRLVLHKVHTKISFCHSQNST